MTQDLTQAVGQAWEHGLGGGGTGHHNVLLVQGREDRGDEGLAHPRGVLDRDRGEFAAPGLGQTGRAAAAGEQLQYGRVGGLRADDPFHGWVDVGEQATDAVGQSGGLTGQVVVRERPPPKGKGKKKTQEPVDGGPTLLLRVSTRGGRVPLDDSLRATLIEIHNPD